jgi:hypothetical protein
MKLQLDTTNKTVRIEGSVNLESLYETLAKLLPRGEWMGFSLEANTTITWGNPITIPFYPIYPYNPYPWWGSPMQYTYGTSSDSVILTNSLTAQTNAGNYVLQEGIYNIETQV